MGERPFTMALLNVCGIGRRKRQNDFLRDLRANIALAALPAALERRRLAPGDRYLGNLWLR
jgi:hypothetical protein